VPLSAVCGSLSYFSPLLFTKKSELKLQENSNILKTAKRKKLVKISGASYATLRFDEKTELRFEDFERQKNSSKWLA
jgi:hypothetical protein